MPPSLLANALLLQTHDRVSDEEAKARADYDMRWKVALGIEVNEQPFAKSTLQLFRAQLILKEKMRAVFTRSLELAKASGYLKERRLKVILDTTYILGRGAVKDTYNLLGDGIQQLCRALAVVEGQELEVWVEANQFQIYFGSSLKGEAQVDWDDEQGRNAFLQGIVVDAQRLMSLAQAVRATLGDEDAESQQIAAAGQLLGQLIEQDVELTGEQAKLKEGVSRDRIVSVHDPEMRHGRKSLSKRFDGHKAAIGVDADSIDLEAMTCTCPAGYTTATLIPTGFGWTRKGRSSPGNPLPFQWRSVMPVRCARSASRPKPSGAASSSSIPRKDCCSRRAPFRTVPSSSPIARCGRLQSIAWLGWCSWASARRVTLAGRRPYSSC